MWRPATDSRRPAAAAAAAAHAQQVRRAASQSALLTLLKARQTSGPRTAAGTSRLSGQALRLRVVEHRRVGVQALGHLVADEVDQTLEDRRHVDVVLGRRLVKFQTWQQTSFSSTTMSV